MSTESIGLADGSRVSWHSDMGVVGHLVPARPDEITTALCGVQIKVHYLGLGGTVSKSLRPCKRCERILRARGG